MVSGFNDLFIRIADSQISDAEFEKEKKLPNGCTINSKEELLYYRISMERFGDLRFYLHLVASLI